MALVGIVSQYALASDNSSLPSLIDDGTFEARRMANMINSQSISEKNKGDSDKIKGGEVRNKTKREGAEKRTAEVEEQRLEEAKRYADERKQQEAQKLEKAQPAPTAVIEQTIQKGSSIPAIARGYEELYERFLRGVLIYKPNKGNDIGRIDLPIASLLNPLESMFDLSRCGDAGQYLSISTGYRKGKVAANSSKYEVWIVPKFVVESEIGRTASHYRDIMSTWSAPFDLSSGLDVQI